MTLPYIFGPNHIFLVEFGGKKLNYTRATPIQLAIDDHFIKKKIHLPTYFWRAQIF